MKFLIDEIERISYNLEKVWKIVDLSNESDTDVKRRRRDFETQLKDMKRYPRYSKILSNHLMNQHLKKSLNFIAGINHFNLINRYVSNS